MIEIGDNRFRAPHGSIVGSNANPNVTKGGKMLSQFCLKCGAWCGQLGQEPTLELYIQHLIQIFREVRRVLRKDGTLWLNIGDSMAGSGSPGGDFRDGKGGDDYLRPYNRKGGVLKPLDACLIPFRLAIALQEDGWYLRSVIIWNKNNTTPESLNGWRWEEHMIPLSPDGTPYKKVKGRKYPDDVIWGQCPGCEKCLPNDGLVLRKGSWRPTDSHEYILLVTKTDKYYGDREAVSEPHMTNGRGGFSNKATLKSVLAGENHAPSLVNATVNPSGRNLRSVWTMSTANFRGEHFAVYPEKLPEICIKAGTSEYGVCPKCGAPWARVVKHIVATSKECPKTQEAHEARGGIGKTIGTVGKSGSGRIDGFSQTLGWRATCSCGIKEVVPAIVLDPFSGTGTTLLVAKKLGRRSIGYEISEQYCAISVDRNKQLGLI